MQLPARMQGVGKTTACGKLALYLMNAKKKVLMVATDVYRPAAIEQLQKLGTVCLGVQARAWGIGRSFFSGHSRVCLFKACLSASCLLQGIAVP